MWKAFNAYMDWWDDAIWWLSTHVWPHIKYLLTGVVLLAIFVGGVASTLHILKLMFGWTSLDAAASTLLAVLFGYACYGLGYWVFNRNRGDDTND